MIRPFKLRDFLLVYRLSDQSVSLNAESALITVAHPLRKAVGSLFWGSCFPTYVWKGHKGRPAAYVQLYLAKESSSAYILNLGAPGNGSPAVAVDGAGPMEDLKEDLWLHVLDDLVGAVGRRGIHSLVAQVGENGLELAILRHAGFAVYTRQDVWVADLIDNKYKQAILQPRRAIDDWDVQLLYANIVPPLIQLVEPVPPLHYGKSWVLREDNELVAFVHLNHGSVGTWMRLLIHPNANVPAEMIVGAAYTAKAARPGHPIYCCVGRYQSWLQTVLQGMGFRYWGSQAVMVKHTVQHSRKNMPHRLGAMPARVAPGSPLIQRFTDLRVYDGIHR
jgi:hypothetical protein